MIKKLLTSIFILSATPSQSEVTGAISYRFEPNTQIHESTLEDLEDIEQGLGEVLQNLALNGYKVTILIRHGFASSDCEVTIEREKSGGGRVGKGPISAGGGGKTKEKVTIKGPCKDVKEIARDMNKGDD